MKRSLLALTLAATVLGGSSQAWAIGCISGGLAGGAVGHVAGHHGLLGAAAGCAIGHHAHVMHRREREREMQRGDDRDMRRGDYQNR